MIFSKIFLFLMILDDSFANLSIFSNCCLFIYYWMIFYFFSQKFILFLQIRYNIFYDMKFILYLFQLDLITILSSLHDLTIIAYIIYWYLEHGPINTLYLIDLTLLVYNLIDLILSILGL